MCAYPECDVHEMSLKSYKIARERRRMGCAAAIYVIILVIDIIVGSAIIAWKCKISGDDDECQLAIGGTVGSVIIWLLLLFVCPYCLVRCDFYPARRQISDTYEMVRSKLTHKKSDQLQLNLQTALALSERSTTKCDSKAQILSQTNLQPVKYVPKESRPASIEMVTETENTPLIQDFTGKR